MNIILRRRGLGLTSCNNIIIFMEELGEDITWLREDQLRARRYVNVDNMIRWGCTASVPVDGYVINHANTIRAANNKIYARQVMEENNISIPATYYSKQEIPESSLPVVGRCRFHHQGRAMTICRSLRSLYSDNRSEYWSELIDKDREFRYYTFFGRIIAVAEKIPHDRSRVAWNNYGGGSQFKNVRWRDWNLQGVLEALKTAEAIGIDFSGVDIMTKNDKPYVLEVNSAPSLTTPYRQKAFAKAFHWVLQHDTKPEHFPLPETVESYRDVIHPIVLELREEE